MADYIVRTYYGDVLRREDMVVVAPISEHTDAYAQWEAWVSAGNIPDIDDSFPPEVLTPVPQSVTPWQIRKALNQLNLRDLVEETVAAQPRDVRDGWEFATEFLRDNPLLNAIAPGLGIDLDEVFRLAATL